MLLDPHTIAPGATVRNLTTDTVRIVRQVNESEGGYMLLVRSIEANEKSPLWTWRADNCELVNPAPEIVFNVHDKVTLGTGSVVREIKDTRIHNKTEKLQYRVDIDGETSEKWVYAEHLHPVVPSAATDADFAQVEPAPDEPGRWLRSQTDEIIDDDDAPVAYNPSATESSVELFEPAVTVTQVAELEFEILEWKKQRDTAQQLQHDAEARAEVAELNNKKLEAKVREYESLFAKPVAGAQPIVAPQSCYEIKIVKLNAALPESAKQWAALLDEGWKENHIASIIDSSDTIWQVITFKRLIDFVPQPTRGEAGHHAALTNPFMTSVEYQSRQPQAVEPDAILEPATSLSKIKLGPIGTSVKEIGTEATSRLMHDFAVQGAFDRAKERIANDPLFNRPLHLLSEVTK